MHNCQAGRARERSGKVTVAVSEGNKGAGVDGCREDPGNYETDEGEGFDGRNRRAAKADGVDRDGQDANGYHGTVWMGWEHMTKILTARTHVEVPTMRRSMVREIATIRDV